MTRKYDIYTDEFTEVDDLSDEDKEEAALSDVPENERAYLTNVFNYFQARGNDAKLWEFVCYEYKLRAIAFDEFEGEPH